MGSVKKWRKRRMAKHKHRKRLKRTRWQRRKAGR
ncbi:MAG: AURKAIP1/COX24 domain-containing protein [Anaerolineae bacterium]